MEAVDDTADPLGLLGDSSIEEAPEPPLKESVGARNVQPAYAQASTGAPIDRIDEQQRSNNPPPVPFPSIDGGAQKRQTQPSISVEQAAKPTFNITVGDPHKVGDLTSSHIVYQIRTKVRSQTMRPEGRTTWPPNCAI